MGPQSRAKAEREFDSARAVADTLAVYQALAPCSTDEAGEDGTRPKRSDGKVSA
jgi:hypothetical protein